MACQTLHFRYFYSSFFIAIVYFIFVFNLYSLLLIMWTASSEFGTYRLCEQRRFRRACASAQSRQNLRCSLIQEVSQEEPSDRKPDLWLLWMAGHAQLKFVITECSKTQIRLTGLMCMFRFYCICFVSVLYSIICIRYLFISIAYGSFLFYIRSFLCNN